MTRTVVVGYDFSPLAARALAWAAELARERGDSVTLLHAAPIAPPAIAPDAIVPPLSPTAHDLAEVESLLRHAAESHGIHAEVKAVAASNPGDAVVRFAVATGADMIVVGTHGRSGIARALLGSVADYVIRHAPCPVVTVREGISLPVAQHASM